MVPGSGSQWVRIHHLGIHIKVSAGDVLEFSRSMRFINFYDSDKNIFRRFQQLMLSLRLHRQRM